MVCFFHLRVYSHNKHGPAYPTSSNKLNISWAQKWHLKCLLQRSSLITVAFILVLDMMFKYFTKIILMTSISGIFCPQVIPAHRRQIHKMAFLSRYLQAKSSQPGFEFWFEVKDYDGAWFFVHGATLYLLINISITQRSKFPW